MNKLERYMNNLSMDALKQMIRFLMTDLTDARITITNQVEEFNKMYPRDHDDEED